MIQITLTCSLRRLLIFLLSTAYIPDGVAVEHSAASPSPAPADLELAIFMKATAIVCAIIFITIFSVYLNFWTAQILAGRYNIAVTAAAGGGGPDGGVSWRCSCTRGIDREILEKFPILVYSTIKNHMIGKGKLECAVCLSEFEDDDTLRLIPKCNHVFHTVCIDVWLASHVTCPLCRSDLRLDSGEVAIGVEMSQLNARDGLNDEEGEAMNETQHHPVEQVSNDVASSSSNIVGTNNSVEDGKDKESKSNKRSRWRMFEKLPRSNSTGHSLPTTENNNEANDTEKYTLRLPEEVRRYILMNHAAVGRSVSYHGAAPLKGMGWSDSDDGSSRGKRSTR